jgi:hypothetical protein
MRLFKLHAIQSIFQIQQQISTTTQKKKKKHNIIDMDQCKLVFCSITVLHVCNHMARGFI